MKIKLILKVKNCKIEFKPDLGPGVLAVAETEVSEPITPTQLANIEDQRQYLIEQFIEVVLEKREKS